MASSTMLKVAMLLCVTMAESVMAHASSVKFSATYEDDFNEGNRRELLGFIKHYPNESPTHSPTAADGNDESAPTESPTYIPTYDSYPDHGKREKKHTPKPKSLSAKEVCAIDSLEFDAYACCDFAPTDRSYTCASSTDYLVCIDRKPSEVNPIDGNPPEGGGRVIDPNLIEECKDFNQNCLEVGVDCQEASADAVCMCDIGDFNKLGYEVPICVDPDRSCDDEWREYGWREIARNDGILLRDQTKGEGYSCPSPDWCQYYE